MKCRIKKQNIIFVSLDGVKHSYFMSKLKLDQVTRGTKVITNGEITKIRLNKSLADHIKTNVDIHIHACERIYNITV